MSSQFVDDNDDLLDVEIEIEGPDLHAASGDPSSNPSSVGSKQTNTSMPSSSSVPPKPKRAKTTRSPVWSHFTRTEEDRNKSRCHYCAELFACDSKLSGTSSMKGHVGRCKMYKAFLDKNQAVLSEDNKGKLINIKNDPELFTRSVNELIVLNELPFSFVESQGFRRFCSNVLPMYKNISRRTATKEIADMYSKEKLSLMKMFGDRNRRVSLTTDIWTAPTTSYSYMVVTAHWIDEDWKMQKRIISFKPITDHRGSSIANQLLECIDEWGIARIFTITVDNASGNTAALNIVKDALRRMGPNVLIQDGAFIHMRCCAHILNLIVRDGMEHVNNSVVAVRNAIKYVRSSYSRLKSFELRMETGKVSRGSLILDCTTRWNSTYLMLISALKLRVAFEKMMIEDKLYSEYFLEKDEADKSEKARKRIGPPTSADWDEVQRLVRFLKIFHNATLEFSASTSVTSTVCYSLITNIERNLITLSSNVDEAIRVKANSMRDKFDKYWDGLSNMNGLVIAASVFDPRNKMQFPIVCFERLYGKNSAEATRLKESVLNLLRSLYEEYSILVKPPVTESVVASMEEPATVHFDLSDDDDGYERMDSLYNQMASENRNEEGSSELEIYLMEKTEPRVQNSLGMSYDILGWWKLNSLKYPVLAELAKDVLAIQVSTVASESAFSTSGRILDPFRSCLTPYMVEVLVCLQQWLRSSLKSEKTVTIAQMLEEVHFQDSLDSKNKSQVA